MAESVQRRFNQQVAIVTGAGQGIGKAVAAQFAAEGATVVAVDRNAATVTETVEAAAVPALRRWLVWSTSASGELDALVAWTIGGARSSGHPRQLRRIHQTRGFLEIEEQDWDRIMGVNLRGLFFCSQTIARSMIEQRYWPDRPHRLESPASEGRSIACTTPPVRPASSA